MAEIDIRSALAGWVRDSGESLYKAGKKVPAERFQWHPKPEEWEGRDTEDQVGRVRGHQRMGDKSLSVWKLAAD